MKEGDVIGVTLDMDEGTLSFSKNGEDLGVAFSTGAVQIPSKKKHSFEEVTTIHRSYDDD
jgi:hypothetical protein